MTEKVLLTPAELSAMMKAETLVVIDTRDPASYAAGHIPGAVNIHEIFTYLAMSTPAPKVLPVDPTAESILVNLAEMKEIVDDPSIVKLDVRDVDEWIADSS